MCRVLEGVSWVGHLVGIIKESGGATYVAAHEKSSAALVEALQKNPDAHITYLSIVGATPTSSNACLASKGRAEVLFDNAVNRACTLRLPMVLGEGDIVSHRLRARALKPSAYGLRMNSLEQPIYAGDVARAILAAGSLGINKNYDLGGLEVISRAGLTRRAAAALTALGERSGERAISIRSFPIGLGKIVVGIMQTLMPNPPLTMAMLEILDHDDQVDNTPVLQALELGSLTGLDEALALTLSGNTQS
jgi:NADH dehydrogenase